MLCYRHSLFAWGKRVAATEGTIAGLLAMHNPAFLAETVAYPTRVLHRIVTQLAP